MPMRPQELGSDLVARAFVTATVTVWDEDARIADERLRLVEKVIQGRDFTCVADWQQGVIDARRFLRTWERQAGDLGWTTVDLSGLHEPPANSGLTYRRLGRYDATGLIGCCAAGRWSLSPPKARRSPRQVAGW
jgi:hypothetical protein